MPSEIVGPGSIRIVSDGTSRGTKVYDADGKELRGVTKVVIHPITPQGVLTASVDFHRVALDVVAEQTRPWTDDEDGKLIAWGCAVGHDCVAAHDLGRTEQGWAGSHRLAASEPAGACTRGLRRRRTASCDRLPNYKRRDREVLYRHHDTGAEASVAGAPGCKPPGRERSHAVHRSCN